MQGRCAGAEGHRGADLENARGSECRRPDGLLRQFEFFGDPDAMLVIGCADLGKTQSPGAAVEQAHAKDFSSAATALLTIERVGVHAPRGSEKLFASTTRAKTSILFHIAHRRHPTVEKYGTNPVPANHLIKSLPDAYH